MGVPMPVQLVSNEVAQSPEPPRRRALFGLRYSAEGEGFEPPVPRGTLVFKTSAFNHSATPPGFYFPHVRQTVSGESGEGGIRTHDELLTHTPLAGERLQPLGHLSQGLSRKRV